MLHEVLLTTAFLAGLVTFFSPCSIALLPTYISYYLGRSGDQATGAGGPGRIGLVRSILLATAGGGMLSFGFVRPYVEVLGASSVHTTVDLAIVALGTVILLAFAYRAGEHLRSVPAEEVHALRSGLLKGLAFGLSTTAGFFTLFLLIGALVIAGSSFVVSYLPHAAFAMAAFIVLIGALTLANVNVSLIPHFVAPRGRGVLSFYAFGIGYAAISAGCLLPVFGAILLNVLTAVSTGDLALAFAVLLAYAGGMGALMIVFSTHVAVAKQATVQYLHRIMPLVKRVSGLVVIAMGLYIMWYDWTFFLAP